MPKLFLDIETAPGLDTKEYFQTKQDVDSNRLTKHSNDKERYWSFKLGGLSPFEGKVILITYQIDDGDTVRLKEWESNESQVLERFYQVIVKLQRGITDDRLKIIGHNILGFDIPFLYNRILFYKLESDKKWLYHWLLKKPDTIDFLQLHLPLNNFSRRGLKHDVLAYAYNLPIKETVGSDEILHYYNKEYEKIIGYSEREFVYPEMYKRIETQGMVSKDNLKKAIDWYNSSNR